MNHRKRKSESMQMNNSATVTIPPDRLPDLFPMFQKGIGVTVQSGCTVKSLLCDQWGIPEDYVMERISTIFLNGQPVDDMDTAKVRNGATLALSAAMPGLVGAVMRRGGFFASLRSGITYHEVQEQAGKEQGRITLKLFNLILKDLGAVFLRQGFWAERSDLLSCIPDLVENTSGSELFIVSSD